MTKYEKRLYRYSPLNLAEREGFEPPERLTVRLISSQNDYTKQSTPCAHTCNTKLSYTPTNPNNPPLYITRGVSL